MCFEGAREREIWMLNLTKQKQSSRGRDKEIQCLHTRRTESIRDEISAKMLRT